jgi:hypothetical protein
VLCADVVNVAGGATEESSGATRNPVALDQDQHVYLLDGESMAAGWAGRTWGRQDWI